MGAKRGLHEVGKKATPIEEEQLMVALKELNERLDQLAKENRHLALRHDTLLGMCIASAQALSGIREGSGAGVGPQASASDRLKGGGANAGVCDEIERRIEELLAGSPELASLLAAKAGSPLARIPGCAGLLLPHFLHTENLATGGSHASVLDGNPMSILICAVICVCRDPQVASTVLSYKDRGDVQNVLTGLQRDLDPLLPQYDAAPEDQRPLLLLQIAVTIMTTAILHVGTTILKPGVIYGDKRDQANLPPEAALDRITSKVGLEPDQLGRILDGLQLFQELLAPLSKQKADISAHMAGLLQQNKASAGKQQHQWPSAQSPSPLFSGTCAAGPAAAAAAAGPAPSLESIEGKMALLGLSSHDTLSSLTDQLARISARTTWLDHCSFWYALGQLSWLQLARMVISFKPFLPLAGLWIRRLACQTSLLWPEDPAKLLNSGMASSTSFSGVLAASVRPAAARLAKRTKRARAGSRAASPSSARSAAAAVPPADGAGAGAPMAGRGTRQGRVAPGLPVRTPATAAAGRGRRPSSKTKQGKDTSSLLAAAASAAGAAEAAAAATAGAAEAAAAATAGAAEAAAAATAASAAAVARTAAVFEAMASQVGAAAFRGAAAAMMAAAAAGPRVGPQPAAGAGSVGLSCSLQAQAGGATWTANRGSNGTVAGNARAAAAASAGDPLASAVTHAGQTTAAAAPAAMKWEGPGREVALNAAEQATCFQEARECGMQVVAGPVKLEQLESEGAKGAEPGSPGLNYQQQLSRGETLSEQQQQQLRLRGTARPVSPTTQRQAVAGWLLHQMQEPLQGLKQPQLQQEFEGEAQQPQHQPVKQHEQPHQQQSIPDEVVASLEADCTSWQVWGWNY